MLASSAQPQSRLQPLGAFTKHKKAAICVDVHENRAVSGGKGEFFTFLSGLWSPTERMFWYWDVETCTGLMSLTKFPRPFGPCLIHPQRPAQILCAASFTIQLWDTHSNKIVGHMNSGGLSGDVGFEIPEGLPAGEHPIAPMELSQCGNYLVTSYDTGVRVWDLRQCRALQYYANVNKT